MSSETLTAVSAIVAHAAEAFTKAPIEKAASATLAMSHFSENRNAGMIGYYTPCAVAQPIPIAAISRLLALPFFSPDA
jgi:hypothetical protein